MNSAFGQARLAGRGELSSAGESGPSLYCAARSLFLLRGFHAVSLRQLADELGVHAGSLYHHIDSKQSLLFDLLEEYESSLVAGLKSSKGNGPTARFESFVKRYLQIAMAQQEAAKLSALEYRSLTCNQQREIDELRQQWQRVLEGILEDGLRKGVFQYDQLEFARAGIIAALHHFATWDCPDATIVQRGYIFVLRMLTPSMTRCVVPKKS